jgi:hypothetical protein
MLQGRVYMNLTPLSTRLPLVVHTGLSKRLFWFAVLSLKSFVGILSFGFQQLFGRLAERLGKTC